MTAENVDDSESKALVEDTVLFQKKSSEQPPPEVTESAEVRVMNRSSLMEKGAAAMRASKYEEAEQAFGSVIASDEGFARGWAGRGEARFRAGKLAGALEDMNEAIRLEHNPIDLGIYCWSCRGEVKMKMGDIDGAIEDFSKYLSFAPADAEALCHRAEAKLKNNAKDSALTDLNLAARLRHPRACELLAKVQGK